MVLERFDDFDVAELEHPVALLHDRHLGAQGGEHGRVLDSDHSRAGDHHGARHSLQVDDAVGVDDRPVVELHAGWPGRPGTGGDHDLVGTGPLQPAAAIVDRDDMRVHEISGPDEDRHPVP